MRESVERQVAARSRPLARTPAGSVGCRANTFLEHVQRNATRLGSRSRQRRSAQRPAAPRDPRGSRLLPGLVSGFELGEAWRVERAVPS